MHSNESSSPDFAQTHSSPTERTTELLERVGFTQILSSEEKFESWLKEIDTEKALDYLVRINGLVRGIPIYKREFEQGRMIVGSSMATTFNSPETDQRQDLLLATFEGIKNLHSNRRRALLAYVSLQAIHPFSDGNGRTGRFLYYMFSNIGKPEAFDDENIEELIEHRDGNETGEAGRELINTEILPVENIYGLVTKYLLGPKYLGPEFARYNRILSGQAAGLIEGNLENIKDENIKYRFKNTIGDATGDAVGGVTNLGFSLGNMAVIKVMRERNLIDKYAQRTEILEKKGVYMYDGNSFFEDVDDIIAEEILNTYYQIQTDFFRTLIDVMEDESEDSLAKYFFVKKPEIIS